MIIADKLSKTNRAEFILYLWQVEDLLRAFQLDFERVKSEYLVRFDLDETKRSETEKWYENLCTMLREEGLQQGGHLQIHKNILADLEDFHLRLLASQKFPYYREMYHRVLSYIVEVRAKGENANATELETCFNTLYGLLLLKLQKKDISTETQQAASHISNMLGTLSDYYLKDKAEPIEF
ncbi:MAG: DUF4924 family protein [Bacteroidaceae bacterium]|jgi:hypothetical protein|nr:DUF4924 family protein [Bacteroidaceae bacterium]